MLDGPGIEPRWGKTFSLHHTHPDPSWGLRSLLSNWCRSKVAGAWCWPDTSFCRRG